MLMKSFPSSSILSYYLSWLGQQVFQRELENEDVEEEFILKMKMKQLMINDENEATKEDSEKASVSREASVSYSSDCCREKKTKPSHINVFSIEKMNKKYHT